MVRRPNVNITLEELRQLIQDHKEKGRELIAQIRLLESHYNKLQEYYGEWENQMNSIQNAINKLSEEEGVPIEKIEEYDALSDMLGDLQND